MAKRRNYQPFSEMQLGARRGKSVNTQITSIATSRGDCVH